MSACLCLSGLCSPLYSARSEPNKLKFGTLTVLMAYLLQPLETLAAMQIVGVESENVSWSHENSHKLASKVKLCVNFRVAQIINQSIRLRKRSALLMTVWQEIQKNRFLKRIASTSFVAVATILISTDEPRKNRKEI